MEELVMEPESTIEEQPLMPPEVEYQHSIEVAMFQVRNNCEEFSISGDRITFIPRVEMLKVENPIETQEYPNSTLRDNSLIIKNVILFTKIS